MISVEKSKASDKKTSTESESKENEKVSKPDEFNAEEAITPTPDGLGESDQANRLLVHPSKVVRKLLVQRKLN